VLKLLDRLVILAYIRSFILCMVSLLSLYIVIDLFTNLEAFFPKEQSVWQGAVNVGSWYFYHSVQLFDRLCEAMVLLAGMFTVAWMQRNNELLPLLSAGVPTRRVLRPVLIGALLVLGAGVANQEFLIPRIAPKLMLDRSDISGSKETQVQACYDSSGTHLEGYSAKRNGMRVGDFNCTIQDKQGNGLVHLSAREARYIPPNHELYSGGWLLTDTSPPEVAGWDNPRLARMIDPGKWFVYTRSTTFDTMTRNSTWYMFFSTARLHDLLHSSDSRRMDSVAVLFHIHMTRPIVGMLLVCMGLSVILRDSNRHVFISAGLCLVLCTIFYAAVYGCKFLGDHELLAPALAAWLPVLIFGPLAFVMFDSIHT
jgi:lipopolysaccharide export system permease protein